MFSFSSDAEPDELCCDVERSTSDDAVVASFAWRMSSVPDIDDGRRVVVGGDLTPGRPRPEEVDVTRVWARVTPVGDVVVESDARGRAGGGPIAPSIVRVGFTVVGVGTLLLDVVLGGVVVLIRTLLPKVATRVMVEGGSEAFPALSPSLLASDRRDAGRDVVGGEKVLDSRRRWLILFGAGVAPAVPLTLIRRFICDGMVYLTQAG